MGNGLARHGAGSYRGGERAAVMYTLIRTDWLVEHLDVVIAYAGGQQTPTAKLGV
jgi:hypothetical protein